MLGGKDIGKIEHNIVMRLFIITILLLFALPAFAQKASPGRAKVDAGYKFQEKLNDGSATQQEVIANWSKLAADSVVRKDPDAWGIAYGCEALLRYQVGE